MDQHYTQSGKCRFTPLYGSTNGSPVCYLLQINDFTMLLDCGWNDRFDVRLLQPVINVVGHVDAVLLSHPDTCHLGALPYLVGKCGMKVPIYATFPIYKMGQMFMYDHCHSRQESEDFDLFTLDDVDAAFRAVVRLRYHQTLKLTGKGAGISITAYAAGHMLGGSVWRILAHDEEVVYALDYNHAKEYHLNGTSLASLFSRPTLMITDSAGAEYKAPDRANRDSRFFDLVLSSLRADGNVLVPVDTAGRVLELMLLLDKYWHEHKLVYPLVLLSSVAPTMVQFAKSCLDWLNDSLARSFQYNLENPFSLRYMKLCTSRGALGALPHGPKLVLASTPSLDAGLSRALCFEWASDPRNVLLFTSPPEPGTLAATILDHSRQQQQRQQRQQRQSSTAKKAHTAPKDKVDGSAMDVDAREPLVVKMVMSRRVFLEGAELQKWEEERELERTGGVKQEEVEMETEDGSLPSPASRSRSRPGGIKDKPLRTNSGALSRLARAGSAPIPKADVEVVDEGDGGPDVLLDGFTPPKDAVAPMFPDEDEPFKLGWDEYGAMLDESEFRASTAPSVPEVVEHKEEVAPVEKRPTKIVQVDASVQVNAQVLYYDYQGRSDGLSVSTFLTQIAPQHLVLVHGTPEGTSKLAQHCQGELKQLRTALYQPGDGDVVEVALTGSFRALLSDRLVACVRPHTLGLYSLAWVEGLLRQAGKADPPVLEPARLEGLGASNHGGIFIGDVKLSDVKQALEAQQMEAHFGYGGTLVCQGGQVLIKKGEQSGHLVLQGALSEDYYRVREVLYAQYNIC